MSTTKTSTTPVNGDAPPTHEDDELNVEIASLLARGAQDTGEPTETLRLDTLTDSEKRVLVALLKERMGHPPVCTNALPENERQQGRS